MSIYRMRSVLASIKLAREDSFIDLTAEDMAFLMRDRIWSLAEKKKARRCIDAIIFGSLDASGLPRFEVPSEFTAGVIATFVHSTNLMIACEFMSGATTVDNMVSGKKEKVSASQLFAMVLQGIEDGGVPPTAETKLEMLVRSNNARAAVDVSEA